MFTLGDIPRKGCRIYSGSEAVVFEDCRLSYGQFEERVNQVANALLGMGLARGERIAILSENNHRYLELYFGIAKAGLVSTPLNYRLSERELAHIINDSGAKAVFFGDDYATIASALRAETPNVCVWVSMADGTAEGVAYENLLRTAPKSDPMVPIDENEMCIRAISGCWTKKAFLHS